jgi:hypothetical protein
MFKPVLSIRIHLRKKWYRSCRERDRCSGNHCCGKVDPYYVFWVCMCMCSLSYPICSAHGPYYIVICVLSGCTTLFHIISYTARFSGKEVNEDKMWVSIFSVSFIWNISHYQKKWRDITMKYSGLYINYPSCLSGFNKSWTFSTVFFKKILKYQNS